MNASRRPGAQISQKTIESIKALNAAPVWYGSCRKCKKRLQGTVATLLEHQCGEKS